MEDNLRSSYQSTLVAFDDNKTKKGKRRKAIPADPDPTNPCLQAKRERQKENPQQTPTQPPMSARKKKRGEKET